ncbi:MAG TPA: RNA methyltransferase [Abditibacteriaceae bacterium]
MQLITTLDDERVASYRNLRERRLRDEGIFITEGALLAQRLLQSHFEIESLFVTEENATSFAEQLQNRAPLPPLYVAKASLLRQIVGFDFHRGVLAIGKRLPFPDVISAISKTACSASSFAFIACPHTETSENLGLIVRSALAFGIRGLLLSNDGADPLSRRCLRQSMGSALTLPIARSADLLQDLVALRQSVGLQLVAAVAQSDGKPIALPQFTWPQRSVLILGNEYQGLEKAWLDKCDFQVTIPLAPDHDSLNVAVATGVLLYHMSSQLTNNRL